MLESSACGECSPKALRCRAYRRLHKGFNVGQVQFNRDLAPLRALRQGAKGSRDPLEDIGPVAGVTLPE
jgi:hypothetical protein